jgi:hypothetical protein
MYCIQCGQNILESAKFCSNCGNKVPSETVLTPKAEHINKERCNCGETKRNVFKDYRFTGDRVCVYCDIKGFCPICRSALRTKKAEQCRVCRSTWRINPPAKIESSEEMLESKVDTVETKHEVRLKKCPNCNRNNTIKAEACKFCNYFFDPIKRSLKETQKQTNWIIGAIVGALLLIWLISSIDFTNNNSSSIAFKEFSAENLPNDITTEKRLVDITHPSKMGSAEKEDPYEIMRIAFVGYPDKAEIRILVETVLAKYGYPITDEYKLKISSMLVSLRKASSRGVTEMEILRHINKYGSTSVSLPDQAGISAVLLAIDK